jgi:methyl-accepting chemotaxis protein
MLLGNETVKESDVVSHRDCALGKWYYSEGVQTCSALPEFVRLGKLHEDMHNAVKKTVRLWNEGKRNEAGVMGNKVYELSEEVIAMIDELGRSQERWAGELVAA